MDPDQLKTLIETMNLNQQMLIERLLSKPESKEKPIINISHIPPFENFDAKEEKFQYYRQRFENYLEMKEIFQDKAKCAQLLLNSIGASNYNILAALIAPKTPNELQYDELMKVLENHLSPKRNPLVSQHFFLSTYQKHNSSISEYVADLRRDIAECEFNVECECGKKVTATDIFLRAQFIRGIKDSWIKEQLLQSELVNFTDIVDKAIALEASKIESRELSNSQATGSSTFTQDDINKISKSNRPSKKLEKNALKSQNIKQKNAVSNRGFKSKRNYIDFEKLGINNLCLRCGRNNHLSRDCRVNKNKLKCNSCKITGHVQKVCVKTLLNANRPNSPKIPANQIKSYENIFVNSIVDIYENRMSESTTDSKKFFTIVKIENHPQKFEIDTGAGYTLIPEDQFRRLGLNKQFEPTNVAFRSYTENIFLPLGKVRVQVEYKGCVSNEDLYVVPNGYDPLLGRVWVRHLKINLDEIDQNTEGQIFAITDSTEIEKQFPDVFEQKVGCVPKFIIKLKLREGAKPTYIPERTLPHALREKVEKELNDLESAGIISKLNTSDWGSPLVVIPKADGSVRLCVDYKVGVNDQLVNVHYPIKKIDEVLNSLRDSKYFCKLDLYKAYLHLRTDEESSIIQTMSTHRGTYKVNRLSFGIKTAPAEFNRVIDQILEGLTKTIAYFDDIVVHGKTMEECSRNLSACLERLREYDLHVNRKKCSFFQTKIEYLGHIIENNKISRSPSKVESIIHMPQPKNVQEVRRFLGMVTYYSRFIPHVSTITYPLRKLLRKNQKFRWNKECHKAFTRLKEEIASDRVLVPFNPKLPITLATDASPVGVAAVISHTIDNQEKPIAFASRSLTTAEMNYSQLDREALAIIFGVSHFFNYIYGRHFVLLTDNQPLSRIFHSKKAIPKMTSARLLRYASYLASFDYTLKFRKGLENKNVDCLSRAPINQTYVSADMFINEEIKQVCSISVNEISTHEFLNADTIRKATDSDQDLSKLKEELQINPEISSEYTLDGGILFKGQRVVIPKVLQRLALSELHRTHVGVTKMKQLARRYIYWKGIDKDIEKISRTCESCAKIKKNPSKVQVHPWDEPKGNWDRIHIDYAGPFQDHYFLIVIDAKSKWAEIKICRNDPTSRSTIRLLFDIFATHGFPQVIVSDNAPIFVSEEFKTYCTKNGIFQKLIAPGHPATYGLAERYVQTLKNRLKAMVDEPLSIHAKVQEILFRYRATPLANNKTPAELYLHRNIRTQLDAVRPMKHDFNIERAFRSRQLSVGDRVQARCFIRNQAIWKFGTVIQKFGKLHYQVKLDDGYTFKRHINQLWKSGIPTKESTDPVAQQPSTSISDARPPDSENFNPEHYQIIKPHRAPTDELLTYQHAEDDDQQQTASPPARRSARPRHPPAYLRDYIMF